MAGAAHAGSEEQLRQIKDDAARFGMPVQELMDAIGYEPEADAFDAWPENMQTVEMFMCCLTQWRYAESARGARCIGLDYGGVETVLRMNGLKGKRRREVFGDIQIMEVTAMGVFNG